MNLSPTEKAALAAGRREWEARVIREFWRRLRLLGRRKKGAE